MQQRQHALGESLEQAALQQGLEGKKGGIAEEGKVPALEGQHLNPLGSLHRHLRRLRGRRQRRQRWGES